MSATVTTSESEIEMVSTSGPGDHSRQIAKQICLFLERENANADPVTIVKAWRSARDCFAVLVENEHPQLEAFLPIIDELLQITCQIVRRKLMERIILGKVSDAQTAEIIALLEAVATEADLIADIAAVELKLSA